MRYEKNYIEWDENCEMSEICNLYSFSTKAEIDEKISFNLKLRTNIIMTIIFFWW